MMRKLPQYINTLFSCMLLFLLDVTVSLLANTEIVKTGLAKAVLGMRECRLLPGSAMHVS